ncbi:hypothetical protein IPJ72_00710 [Candidatus Peregrinibacteria bacterium]|nr:MAG: hypothetical protein IPJ72_00710 [Candidatus Peregrinibacteria bacterium]
MQDINLEVDLIEEVARIYGYEQIPFTLPIKSIKPALKNEKRVTERQIRNQWAAFGFNEIYTFAFLGAELLSKCGMGTNETMIEVANPISSDMAIMRQSLLPRTLETIANNERYKNTFRLFELSRVYVKKAKKVPSGPN